MLEPLPRDAPIIIELKSPDPRLAQRRGRRWCTPPGRRAASRSGRSRRARSTPCARSIRRSAPAPTWTMCDSGLDAPVAAPARSFDAFQVPEVFAGHARRHAGVHRAGARGGTSR
ncbi:MAG: hypothetical protein M0C28_16640 [Candidatus Moduliflexus flocculans]|nr:hypothetical protein [Candidatus Moduliflexus flocculans]